MKRLVVAIPSSHAWLWLQTCLSALAVRPPILPDTECKVVVVDNSWDWSPSILGVTQTRLGRRVEVFNNPKPNKFHATALDAVVEKYQPDFLFALETDVAVLRHGWLIWFMEQLKPTDYAVGHWHHEQFVNPSCTLYRGKTLLDMLDWCKGRAEPTLLRWGDGFSQAEDLRLTHSDPIYPYREGLDRSPDGVLAWLAGPFTDKRGWPLGTTFGKGPAPTGQMKGKGWYEPGQMLHHWAVEAGWTYTVCQTATTTWGEDRLPTQTFYGMEQTDAPSRNQEIYEDWNRAWACHFWGGTRALDVLKHEVKDIFVQKYMPFWLQREARFWRDSVAPDIQQETLTLIKKYGFHTRSCYGGEVKDRDAAAAEYVKSQYALGGLFL